MRHRDKSRFAPIAVSATVAAALLSVLSLLYVLSFGPAMNLLAHGQIAPEPFAWFYRPLFTVVANCPPLARCMQWYLSFYGFEVGPPP